MRKVLVPSIKDPLPKRFISGLTTPSRRLPALLLLIAALLINACGPSGPVGVPAPPRDVTATPIPGGVNVTWVDQSSDEDGFVILRMAAGEAGPPSEEVGRVGADESSYNDFPPAKDGSYVYAVQSFNVIGPSDPVTQAPAAPVTPLPGVDVAVKFDGNGQVVVSGGPVTKTCTTDCQLAFAAGTAVTFNAQSAEGAVFAGWAGACSGAGECQVELDEAVEVEARFRLHVLQLSLDGDSPVRLTMFPADDFGVSRCDLGFGDECALAYGFAGPLAVSITAEPLGPGGSFEGFTGPCSSQTKSYCLVNVSGATPVAFKAVHPPVAADDSYTLLEDEPLEAAPGVLANDVDSPDDTLSAVLVDGPTNGQLDLSDDGSFTYTPATDFYGSDSFTYRAKDAYGSESETVTVSLGITAVNDPPVFDIGQEVDAGPANGAPRSSLDFATGIGRGGGSDEAGQSLTFTVTRVGSAQPTMAVAPTINNAGTLAFQPTTGTFGSATYEVTLSDNGGTANGGQNTSATKSFTINVASFTLTTEVIGQGTINPTDAAGEYGWGASVQLTTSAASGYRFVGWQGACTGTNITCNVTMTEDRAVTAEFEPIVQVAFGPGTPVNFTVTSSPAGLSCWSFVPTPGGCTATFPTDSQVTLTNDSGNAFNYSNVDCTQGEPTQTCTFTVTAPVTVTLSAPQPPTP